MTKPIYIAAAVALALSVSACGRDDDATMPPTGPTSSTGTSSGPLVTGEPGASSSASATGGTSGLGASGTGAGGTSTSTPGIDGTGSQAGTGGALMSPDSNASSAAGSGTTYGSDAEKSKR
jgi:hypothetical protein